MAKINLPVILLKGIIILPKSEIKLEFDNDVSKNVIDLSEMFHDNKILIVNQTNHLEENPNIKNLPNIGVIAKISDKLVLPNGNVHIKVTGLKRAYINEFLNINRSNEILESIITPVADEIIESEDILINKLITIFSNHCNLIPEMSNSIISYIKELTSLSILCDVIIPYLNIDLDRFKIYLETISVISRFDMILEDIVSEQEIYKIDREIENKIRNTIENSQRDFILQEKSKILKEELNELEPKEEEIKQIKETLEEKYYPTHIKEKIISELNRYESMNYYTPELDLVKNYIDWLLKIPNSGTNSKINLKKARLILDESHFGLEKVKDKIIENIAINKKNNSILCLVGPPGTGKTSLVYSIAKAMNKKLCKLSVAGITDDAIIKGHRKTYVASKPGRIVELLVKAKENNPVFLIDEIDKIGNGQIDLSSSLLELLDKSQNKEFIDNYIEEEIDLSSVFFITTANYINNIPEALRDRLDIINISGYTNKEKIELSKNYLINNVIDNCNIKFNIKISDEMISYIISGYTYESGVRELERCFDKIISYVATRNILLKKKLKNVIIDKTIVNKSLGIKLFDYKKTTNNKIGVVTGLAYTTNGGDTINIESTYYKGSGKLILTGSLGDVMQESATIALSYIKANAKSLKIDENLLLKNDFHIHIPSGAIKKDGPSAGITITTSLISLLKNKEIKNTLSMTGEISLKGDVLKIGGLKEKSLAALRDGIKTIIIPYDNVFEIDELPTEVKEKIKFISVKNYEEILKIIK